MSKQTKTLVYTMTPRLARVLRVMRKHYHDGRLLLLSGAACEAVKALDAQAVTAPTKKRRAKR